MALFVGKALCGLIAFGIVFGLSGARAGDSHADYYYPQPQTREVYASPLPVRPDANKRTRIGFTVGLNNLQQKRAYAPTYHLFAKGAHAQKLIIVATRADTYNTLFRLRALLASLTSEARRSPIFRDTLNPENVNFLDLLRLTGFEQVTVTDGDKLAHRIVIR